MRSKSFLSGVFSVVSFILISNFVIPSTFALCPPDVSGRWDVKGADITECCTDPSDNGTEKLNLGFVVTQDGDGIIASWVEGTDTHSLTGDVNGHSVYATLETTSTDTPGCVWVDHFVGIINRKGNRILFVFTGAVTCDTCRETGWLQVKIVK